MKLHSLNYTNRDKEAACILLSFEWTFNNGVCLKGQGSFSPTGMIKKKSQILLTLLNLLTFSSQTRTEIVFFLLKMSHFF